MTFIPTLMNGSYTDVSFTLDQASGAAAFDSTQVFNLRLEHGAGGFGFDSGNIVEFDNVIVQIIPEPTALSLLGLGAAGWVWLRRRKS